MSTDWTALPDNEFWSEYIAVNAEGARRKTLDSAPGLQDDLNESVLAAQGIADGDPWRQPTGGHDAYPTGITVTHDGATWENLTPANVWEPGVSGWRQLGGGGEPAPWVQPTGAHDAYALGAVVTHDGQTWTSTIPANVWAPGVYGWVAG